MLERLGIPSKVYHVREGRTQMAIGLDIDQMKKKLTGTTATFDSSLASELTRLGETVAEVIDQNNKEVERQLRAAGVSLS